MANEVAINSGSAVTETGHPKGFMFLFAGEFAERFSFYGMRAILPLYLSDQMGYGEAGSGTYYPLFLGLCYFLPLLGGYIADNFLGKYWTIVGFSLPYVVGQFLVGFENTYLLIFALGLLAMGTGVIKPNISTLMGITYDQQRPGQEKLRSNAFQYFYMSINIGAFLSTLLVPIVRDQTGSYLYAFLLPAVFMVVALTIFAAGKKFYGVERIGLTATKAATSSKSTAEETVAKLRVLGQVGLLFALVTFFWAVFDQSSYTWVFFAKTYMNRQILGFDLAPDSIQALNPLFIVIFIGGTLLYRTVKSAAVTTGIEKPGMPATTKMFIGFLLTSACMGVMALAGYRTGDPEPAVMVKSKEVELYFPLGKGELKTAAVDFAKKEGNFANSGGTLDFSTPSGRVQLEFPKYTTAAGNKITFTDAVLTLADGKKLVFTDGRLDFTKSAAFFSAGKLEPAGALDVQFRQGQYQLPDGVLLVKRGNNVEVLAGERLKLGPSKSKEEFSVTVGMGKYVKPESRVSVWWMFLAFLVITAAEILISVTGLELAFVVAPENMKGFITACWLLTVALANWFINAPIADLYPAMHPGNYFLMLAGIGLVVAFLFIPVSRRFNRAMAASKLKANEAASVEGNSGAV